VKVSFDATLDDFVDASNRVFARSKAIKSFRSFDKQFSIVCALICGLSWGFRWEGTFLSKSLAGAIAALLFLGFFLALNHVLWQPLRIRRSRRLCREQLGTQCPVTVEIEVAESGIHFRQLDSEHHCTWKSITSIEERDDCIEIWRQGRLLVVRGRAFHSDEERKDFLHLCEKWSGHSPDRFIPQP